MLIKENERYRINGAAFDVHATLGCGFTEYVYQDALEIEFQNRNIPYVREKHLVAYYKGIALKHDYYADFVCFDEIIVECKAVEALSGVHEAQVINYLKIGKYPLGILFNFGEPSLVKKFFFNKT